MRAKLSFEMIECIFAAPVAVSHADLAARLGVSASVVRKYRDRHRAELEEAAMRERAIHAREHVRGVLDDLTDARRLFRAAYERTEDPARGRLWLASIQAEIAVLPDPSDLTDEELVEALRAMRDRLDPPETAGA